MIFRQTKKRVKQVPFKHIICRSSLNTGWANVNHDYSGVYLASKWYKIIESDHQSVIYPTIIPTTIIPILILYTPTKSCFLSWIFLQNEALSKKTCKSIVENKSNRDQILYIYMCIDMCIYPVWIILYVNVYSWLKFPINSPIWIRTCCRIDHRREDLDVQPQPGALGCSEPGFGTEQIARLRWGFDQRGVGDQGRLEAWYGMLGPTMSNPFFGRSIFRAPFFLAVKELGPIWNSQAFSIVNYPMAQRYWHVNTAETETGSKWAVKMAQPKNGWHIIYIYTYTHT